MDKKTNTQLSRRDLLKGAALTGLGTALVASDAQAKSSSNALKKENEKEGTTDWQLTYTKVDPATRYRCPWIEGYVSQASVKAGDQLDIMVSTRPAVPFQLDIYRMGYYGGTGARHMDSIGPLNGTTQTDPDVGDKRLIECAWDISHSITIPEDWVSGVYLGKLTLLEGRFQSYIVFIVTDDREADVLFQCSDNTWQAYNRWPDNYALYDNGESPWALKPETHVSYDRPYGKYCQILDAPLSQGSGEFLLWEFPLAYWLEREGYDVTYCSNTDVHANPRELMRSKAFLSVGHDEYWSLEQFNNVQNAVNEGVNVAFLSGNTCCFVSPLQPSSTGQPHRIFNRAGRFGGVTEAEAKKNFGPFPLEGPNESSLIGARTITPYNGSGDWICSQPDSWIFNGTGMKKGDSVPGLIGWEFHGDPADIPGLEVVAEGIAINASEEKGHWTATLYPGPKENWVFNAATIWWAQGLSTPPGHMLPYSHFGRPHGPDERVQKITRNLLDKFLG